MQAWIAGARVRTLPAAVVPVLVGTAAARGVDGPLVLWRALAAGVVAVALQVATNFANDYSDGVRGTDDPGARVGPVRLAGWFYTGGPRPYGYLGLGEVFVFVFFGVVATVGSTYVQVEQVTALSLLASVPVGLLATALLVTNNLRDIPGDTVAGKRTLAVRLGDGRTRGVFVGMVATALVLVMPLALARPAALLALMAAAAAIPPIRAVRAGARGPALIPVLAATGRLQLLFGVLLATGLALSA
jgi:1,4-dihydroxy-2-naphthoate polyprenyltransferase